MNGESRIGRTTPLLLAALAVGVTLFASTPAKATGHGGLQKPPTPPRDWGTIQLANVGDEPFASGQASMTNVRSVKDDAPPGVPPTGVVRYSGRLSVTCHNLTPGATYWTPAGTFTADADGDGKVSGNVVIWGYYDEWWGWSAGFWVDVVRVDPAEPTVLTGGWYFYY